MTLPSAETIEELAQGAEEELAAIADLEGLDRWRIAYLGRRGRLTNVLRGLPQVELDQRRQLGALANRTKQLLESRLAEKTQQITQGGQAAAFARDRLDVTLPGRAIPMGRLHPSTQIVREICDAFIGMGFSLVEGPEVEWDRYNFEMLNIPAGHPARDMFNSLWVDYRNEAGEYPMLLRTHTSPMQARVMESMEPPVRVVVPGKVYRYEATDATHEWHFHQIEGLAVDEGITFADLKGTLYEFARRLFGGNGRSGSGATISRLLNRGLTFQLTVLPAMDTGKGAASAGTAVGSKLWGQVWCIPRCCRRRGTTRTGTRGLPLG